MYVELSSVPVRSAARVDPSGWPACEKCGRRLTDVKHHRPYGHGRACSPQCKSHSASTNSTPISSGASTPVSSDRVTAARSNKKRNNSHLNDGQKSSNTRISPRQLRVRATKPVQHDRKKLKLDREAAILADLDATHRARMGALTGAASISSDTKNRMNNSRCDFN